MSNESHDSRQAREAQLKQNQGVTPPHLRNLGNLPPQNDELVQQIQQLIFDEPYPVDKLAALFAAEQKKLLDRILEKKEDRPIISQDLTGAWDIEGMDTPCVPVDVIEAELEKL